MTKGNPADEDQNLYLKVGSSGPPAWLLLLGGVAACLAFVAVFYGLYTINLDSSPTLTPGPQELTQAAMITAAEPTPEPHTPSPGELPLFSPSPALTTTTLSAALTPTATVQAITYTVQQGDTLIGIAYRLNVDAEALAALNGISGETIYPDQVLALPPTVTPWPESGPFPHTVTQGESLIAIAAFYDVTVEEIQALNGLTSDAIYAGQKLLIPGSGTRPPTPTPWPTQTPTPTPWIPAVITGDLESVYSLATVKGHFTLHVPPDTRAASESEMDKVAGIVETALEYGQTALRRRLSGRFEVYVAGTPFDAPRTHQRAYSQPQQERLFLLYDGSGTPAERLYFAAYALTPLVATRALSEASSSLLAEGLAVYAGGQALAGAGERYLLPEQFCAAYQAAGRLPRVSRPLTFGGHLGYLEQHFAAGCFVGYLMETQGGAALAEVYVSGDYRAVYGQSLSALEADWSASLSQAAGELAFDPGELVAVVEALNEAYRGLWEGFVGTPEQFADYERLDRARLALWQGRLGAAREYLGVEE